MEIRIAGTESNSIVDGPGIRYTVFVQGCPHNCDGCHNPHTHSFDGGKIIDTDVIYESIIEDPLLDGVTFSGGEPFCQSTALYELGRKIKENTSLNIVTYTGYDFEYLLENKNRDSIGKLLEITDILIDGKFIKEQKSYELKFKGSRNQRIIDVKSSLEIQKVVIADI
jgi:anaerobic ribonucleoside-triphosphate reductase activating protein